MTLKEFLLKEEWNVYQVSGSRRQFFGDTAFGPMWKDIPYNIEVTEEMFLETLRDVEVFLGFVETEPEAESKVAKCDDVLL